MEIIAVDIDEVISPTHQELLIEGARSALESLRDNYRLEIVTARNPWRREETALFIARALPDVFDDIHFIRDYNGDQTTKAQVCLDIGARYLIEDLDDHCEPAIAAGIEVIQFGKYPFENWFFVRNFFSEKMLLTN